MFFVFLLLMLWQVETVAQFGVVFLLFALGLEFSMTKVGIRWLLTVTKTNNRVDFTISVG